MSSKDIVEQMASEPGTRPVCARLTATMRRTLRLRKGPGVKGLKARRLVCPGDAFALTPMGAQWREDLVALDRTTRAIRRALELLDDGAERSDVRDVLAGGLG